MNDVFIVLYLWIAIMFVLEMGCEIINLKTGKPIMIVIMALLSSITLWLLVNNNII